MLPPQQSRQFHLYLHLIYANHKHITHKMWKRVTTSYGVPLMILALPETLSGFLLVDKERKEKRLQKLLQEYKKGQDSAKSQRLNLWRYGDFTDDDAREFGMTTTSGRR